MTVDLLPDFSVAMAQLTDLSQQIDAASDAMNARILGLEENMRSAGVRWAAGIKMSDGNILKWAKPGDTWRLMVEYADKKLNPLVNEPRHVRIEACLNMHLLLNALERTGLDILQTLKYR